MAMSSIHILRYRISLHTYSKRSVPASFTSRLLSISAKKNTREAYRIFQKKLQKKREGINDLHSPLAPLSSSPDDLILSPNHSVGLVTASHSNFMRVMVQSSQSEYPGEIGDHSASVERINVEILCVVKAILKKIGRRVMVGDKVVIGSIDWINRRGVIENVFTRKSEILDPPVSNVSHLLVFFSMEQPKLGPISLTRFLVEAESTGIPITLALNKCELVEEDELSDWKDRLEKWGYKPVFCSVETKYGIEDLKFVLKEQTTVVVGPSGVGKSSLINLLRNNEDDSESVNWFDALEGSTWFEDQRVGEVSARTGRGKHTTRNVSLLPLNQGGYLADTPGFNMPGLINVTTRSLPEAFHEVCDCDLSLLLNYVCKIFFFADQIDVHASEAGMCMFNDCLHLGEKGCAVKNDWERYPYYLQLLDELKVREEFQFRTQGTKREPDVRYKTGSMGVKQAEPRLDFRKHKRVSRKTRNQKMFHDLAEEGFMEPGDVD